MGDRLDRAARREPDFGLCVLPLAVAGTVLLPVALAQQKWWLAVVGVVWMGLTYPVVWRRFRGLVADADSASEE